MSKIWKPVVRVAAPIVGAALGTILLPGIGTALGASLGGAAGGYAGTRLTGGSGSEALLAGATGGLGGYASAGGFGTAAGSTLSGGLQGPTQGTGILGSVTRAAPGLTSAVRGASTGLSSMLGTSAGSPLTGGLQGPTQGTGILGNATRGISSVPGLSSVSSIPMGGSSMGSSALSNILGGYIQTRGAEKQKDAILEQLGRAQAEYAPYKESGLAANRQLSGMLASGELGGRYGADDFEVDPGYQFRLTEGQRALDRRMASGGNYFSGDALRASQEYGQGLASQEYQNAFNRNLSEEQQIYNMLYSQQGVGANAAQNLAGLYGDEAATRARAYGAKANALSQMLGGF